MGDKTQSLTNMSKKPHISYKDRRKLATTYEYRRTLALTQKHGRALVVSYEIWVGGHNHPMDYEIRGNLSTRHVSRRYVALLWSILYQ